VARRWPGRRAVQRPADRANGRRRREHDYRAIGARSPAVAADGRAGGACGGSGPAATLRGCRPVGRTGAGAPMPVIAGVMGPKASPRARADGVDAPDDGRRPRRHAACSDRRRGEAAGRTEARTCRPASGALATAEAYCVTTHTYMGIMGGAVGDWAAGSVTCFTCDAERRTTARMPAPTSSSWCTTSDPTCSAPRCPASDDVDGLPQEVSAAVALDLRRPTFRMVSARRGRRAQGSRPPTRRHDGARSAGADVRPPAAGPGVAPHHLGFHHPVAAIADPGRYALQRHHVEPPARGRSRQPLAARLGGQRSVPPPSSSPTTTTPSRRPRRFQRRPPDQPRVQGDPPRRARRRDGCTVVHAQHLQSLIYSTTFNLPSYDEAAAARLARRHRSHRLVLRCWSEYPGAGAITSVRVAARRPLETLRRPAGRHPP
jgi:hypothetical protein